MRRTSMFFGIILLAILGMLLSSCGVTYTGHLNVDVAGGIKNALNLQDPSPVTLLINDMEIYYYDSIVVKGYYFSFEIMPSRIPDCHPYRLVCHYNGQVYDYDLRPYIERRQRVNHRLFGRFEGLYNTSGSMIVEVYYYRVVREATAYGLNTSYVFNDSPTHTVGFPIVWLHPSEHY